MKKLVLILLLLSVHNFVLAQSSPESSQCNNDMDGDGISGCFDKCPNTPNGATVDSHGCPMDTDGDGVIDYLDKQLITPTECQPVDKDGIGVCPCNCPGQYRRYVCGAPFSSHSVYFTPGTTALSPYVIQFLHKVAERMRSNPNFPMLIKSNIHDESEAQYKIAWQRLNNMRNYLIEISGIDQQRLMFLINNYGKQNTVEFSSPPEGYESGSKLPPITRNP